MMNSQIKLLYCGNGKAYEGILFSLLSIMRRTKRPLDVTVFTAENEKGGGIDIARASYLSGLLSGRKDGSVLHIVDMTRELRALLEDCPYRQNRFTPYALLRLLADKSDLCGRILYLDADTVAFDDIGKVYDRGLFGMPMGAVKDAIGSLTLDPSYFNSGVLLIDMEKAREKQLFSSARRVLKKNKLIFPDQSALNYADVEVCLLPRKCNEQRNLRSDTVIRHYCRKLVFFPYPHVLKKSAEQKYGMSKKEYGILKSVYEEYLLEREGRWAN